MSGVVIIGAGPGGLTAGYELSKLGYRSTILEADAQVGGLSRTVNYRGYRFDIGGHRFFSKVRLVNDIWREILGEDFLLRPRLSRIYYRERFFDYPLKPLNALNGLGPVEAALVILSYAKAKVARGGEETNLEQWVANRFGHRLYKVFFKTYTEKVWGIPCTEISADWAAQRIRNLSLQEALKNALLRSSKSKDGDVITTLIDQFHYPRHGPGMMWESCEELLSARGNPTVRGVKVNKIRHRRGRVECVFGQTESGEQVEFAGDHFVSTMPLRSLILALDPPPPENVLQAAGRLRYRDYLTVVLMVKRESVFPDNWIYIHSPEVKMGRIQNYKNWSPYMVPDPSRTSLGLEYFLWDKDEEWTWSKDRLMDVGRAECVKIGLIEPDEVEDGTVVRMKKAYPVYDHLYRESLETVRNYLETFSNLQTVGRNGLHRYNNQDHSMLTAVYAARNIAGEQNDVWSVNTEMEYHEEVRQPKWGTGDRLVPTRIEPVQVTEKDAADEMIEAAFARLDPVALGAAIGTVSGLLLWIATIVLLVRGGPVVGPTLGLLGNFLIGFKVTLAGSFIGLVEAGAGGFAVGYAWASFRNFGISAYAYLVQRRAEAEANRNLIDDV